MDRLIFGLLFFILSPLVMAAPASIGVITGVEGGVQLLRDNSFYEAGIGVEIYNTDAVVTGTDAEVQFDMVDGTTLLVGSDSRLRFSEYELDDKGNVVSAVVDVLSGWLRFAVAKLQDNSTYNIDTPTMTIGIRGTEGVAQAANENSELFLHEGSVNVIGVDGGAGESPVEIEAGEYVQRPLGQQLRREAITERLQNSRMPPRMRQRLARRVHLLGNRALPRRLRAAEAAEVHQFLLENPEARNEIRQRLRHHRIKRHRLQQQRIRRMQRMQQRRNPN